MSGQHAMLWQQSKGCTYRPSWDVGIQRLPLRYIPTTLHTWCHPLVDASKIMDIFHAIVPCKWILRFNSLHLVWPAQESRPSRLVSVSLQHPTSSQLLRHPHRPTTTKWDTWVPHEEAPNTDAIYFNATSRFFLTSLFDSPHVLLRRHGDLKESSAERQ